MGKVFLLMVVALANGFASAQSWPTRPIRMMIPQPAGGTMDTLARAILDPVSRTLGQSIVIDNRPGANGIIAGETLARAVPDGHTLLYTSASMPNNQLVYKKLPFDVTRDFAPVTQVVSLPGYLVLINAQLPAQSMREFIELTRKGKPVFYGSSGVGSSQHLLGELINARTGAKLAHVPYKGFAPLINAVLGNEIQVAFGSPVTVLIHLKAGRMRALAYTGAKRYSGMPELPTLAESAIPGFVYEASWHAIFAPVGTPAAVVNRIREEVRTVVLSPRMHDQLEAGGHVPVGGTPAELAVFLRKHLQDTAEQMRIAGVKPE